MQDRQPRRARELLSPAPRDDGKPGEAGRDIGAQAGGKRLQRLHVLPVETIAYFVAEDELAKVQQVMGAARELRYETAVVHKDGTRIPVEFIVRTLEMEGEKLRMTIVRDIRDRLACGHCEGASRQPIAVRCRQCARQLCAACDALLHPAAAADAPPGASAAAGDAARLRLMAHHTRVPAPIALKLHEVAEKGATVEPFFHETAGAVFRVSLPTGSAS